MPEKPKISARLARSHYNPARDLFKSTKPSSTEEPRTSKKKPPITLDAETILKDFWKTLLRVVSGLPFIIFCVLIYIVYVQSSANFATGPIEDIRAALKVSKAPNSTYKLKVLPRVWAILLFLPVIGSMPRKTMALGLLGAGIYIWYFKDISRDYHAMNAIWFIFFFNARLGTTRLILAIIAIAAHHIYFAASK